MSAFELADYLRVLKKDGSPCVARIYNLVNQGRLPFYKPFGKLLFKKSDVERLIESSKKGGFRWK